MALLISYPYTISTSTSFEFYCLQLTIFCLQSHQTIKKDEFYALLSVADLGVITPLRDGMNTTSLEFVIAQDRSKRSPLVLSATLGSAIAIADLPRPGCCAPVSSAFP